MAQSCIAGGFGHGADAQSLRGLVARMRQEPCGGVAVDQGGCFETTKPTTIRPGLYVAEVIH